jgi:lipopolysaccharide export system protein LptA
MTKPHSLGLRWCTDRIVTAATAVGLAVALPLAALGSSAPIAIEADQGIEWRQQEKTVLARGNARAVRGEMRVNAETLTARYREGSDGSAEIWRVEAEGGVEIVSPTETLRGERGTFDLDKDTLVLSGGTVRLISGDSEITAQRDMEYSTRTRVLIARGNAEARQGQRLMRGETLTAHLRDRSETGAGSSRLKRIEADTNVQVITPREVMRGDRGAYDVERGVASLTGAVKITRGDNQLNGCRGEMDLNAGVGRLFACPGAADDRARVHGIIVPGPRRQE